MQLSDIQWVVQRNITGDGSFQQLKSACQALSIGFVEVEVIPFANELPVFDRDKPGIYYGSTSLMNQIYAHRSLRSGLFYDPDTFAISNYLTHWGSRMLNHGATITTFRELMDMPYDKEKLLFIRPDADSKSFAGEVRTFQEIAEWYGKLRQTENSGLSLDTKIVVGEPYNIRKEWRLWIVNKQVVAASQYREYFQLKKVAGCPADVIAFAEQCCQHYTPHDIFVMDVGLCADTYYIIECGCMNSAGFYRADIETIVKEVSTYRIRTGCD
jgi:hypothetical protein